MAGCPKLSVRIMPERCSVEFLLENTETGIDVTATLEKTEHRFSITPHEPIIFQYAIIPVTVPSRTPPTVKT
jgi:hypothetical protein